MCILLTSSSCASVESGITPLKVETNFTSIVEKLPKFIEFFFFNIGEEPVCISLADAPPYSVTSLIELYADKNYDEGTLDSKGLLIPEYPEGFIPEFILIPPTGIYLSEHPIAKHYDVPTYASELNIKYAVGWQLCDELVDRIKNRMSIDLNTIVIERDFKPKRGLQYFNDH